MAIVKDNIPYLFQTIRIFTIEKRKIRHKNNTGQVKHFRRNFRVGKVQLWEVNAQILTL